MEAIVIHPSSFNQLEKVKGILNELGIPFEKHPNQLSDKLEESIARGLAQSDNQELISLDDFKKKFTLRSCY